MELPIGQLQAVYLLSRRYNAIWIAIILYYQRYFLLLTKYVVLAEMKVTLSSFLIKIARR